MLWFAQASYNLIPSCLRKVPSLIEGTLFSHPLLPYEPMWLGPNSYQSHCVFRRPAESV